MSNYEDLMKKILLEAIKKERLEEQEGELDPQGLAKIATKDGKEGTGDKYVAEDLLGISEIISNLSRGTEIALQKSGKKVKKEYYSGMEKDFKIVRDAFKLEGAGSSIKDSDDLVNRLNVFFQIPEKSGEQEKQAAQCDNLRMAFAQTILKTALSSIFVYFNDSSAGFVNERFLAGILGGKSVPVGQGTIADLIVGDTGISLKSKKAGTGGSIRDLMKTLGIILKIDNKRDGVADSQKPEHSKGLYYLIALKTKASDGGFAKVEFRVFHVDRKQFLEDLKKANIKGVTVKGNTISINSSQNLKALAQIESASPLTYTGAFSASRTSSLTDRLGVKSEAYKLTDYNASVFGTKGKKKSEQSSSDDFIDTNRQLYNSLMSLNAFMVNTKRLLLQYSLNPTAENLIKLIDKLKVSTQFVAKNIDEC